MKCERRARQRGGFDANRPHHATVLVLQQMTVIHERSNRIRVTKVHPHADAGIRRHPVVEVRYVYCIAQKRLGDRHPEPVQQQKVDLMHVEGV